MVGMQQYDLSTKNRTGDFLGIKMYFSIFVG